MISRPLVVDLDGTLLRSDVLIESGFSYLKAAPFRLFSPLAWLMRGGKPTLKSKLAAETELDVSVLPYDPQIVEWLNHERANGRTIVLATASHEKYAHAIARHLQLFDDVLATDQHVNLSSHRKKDRLVAKFGEHGFDYAGNSRDDLPVWKSAARAYVVNAPAAVRRAAEKVGNVERVFESRPPALKTWAKSLRIHQWLKNLLILVPLLAGHMLGSLPLIADAVLAFIAFGLCASSVYLLNDLLDLEDDRHHPSKCRRPLASGALPLTHGLAAFPALLAGAFALAFVALPWRFSAVLLSYYALTLAYSAVLKRLVMVDVVVLAMLYTVRIVAGTTAIATHLTFWLLAFSMFIFLSLALVKRYAELLSMKKRGLNQSRGRGYMASDLELVSSLGCASGYLSVLVLAMYIQDPKTAHLYSRPQLIWLACPLLLYWISRTWIIAHRGHMHDDPIIFAIRDRLSLTVIGLCGLVFWAAI
ncbi:UbiA family prenyltransferase [Burkholderia multivorans]|uniref:UbiA family prenyltransferase n=1 Tax=Burkholderia multivorans TaxID=87883 RepID=UPI000D00F012|nr:UbiA family prenyltransferase [Burkholderia multivorans]MBR7897112.1 UbiA family prenyltransferase [Burkholderia multivorans]MBU9398466.1 UbiA family prenyltransferase [Burkholderia multivorans]MDN8050858.1 UbiA family prenyltransferase [Burkholderia multivorans]MDR9238246.1 Decaprenyl-phosphate phosphoribosyltransferase [Burkholderia multivorans]MDR9268993.1 Decaprenyl-phosphate phosphoribosyltransferase [Burkholderia multivorans]